MYIYTSSVLTRKKQDAMKLSCLEKSRLCFQRPGQAQCQKGCLEVGSYSFGDQPPMPCFPNTLSGSVPVSEGEVEGKLLMSWG